jgi:hypothetical protein
MKYILVDLTNNGVIFSSAESVKISKLKWDFNILKSCILDTNIFPVTNPNALLNRISNEFIYHQSGEFFIGDSQEKNQIFLTKQNKVKLIYPLIDRLTVGLFLNSINNHMTEFCFPMEDTLMHEIRNSNPNNDTYSSGIINYAQTVGMTNEEAFRELSVEADSIHSLKMRIYSVAKHYENVIREVNTKEEADGVMEIIEQKIFRESRI